MEFRENRKAGGSDFYENAFYDFLIKHCEDDLKEILTHPNSNGHFAVLLNYVALNESISNISNELLRSPEKILPAGDKAACRALLDIYDKAADNRDLILKRHVHVRIHSMPACWDRYLTSFPGTKEIGNFLTLVGTIVRITTPKLLEFTRLYRCTKCKQIMTVDAVASRCHAFPRTLDKCDNLCVGGKVEPVESTESNSSASNSMRFKDYQEVKLQEQINKMDFGIMPKALWVILEDDLVDTCKPGDDVVITGTLFLRWKPFRVNQPASSELVFKANHVQVKNDQRASVLINEETVNSFEKFWELHQFNPFEGKNLILKSFCPQVYGMYLVKLAVCVVLAGGVPKVNAGTHVRGESHLLLVGDPGTGKSQMLKYASKISGRSVMTTGTGTTTAGLTVSAVKDSGEWHLEAGALVLADGGVCCIDEFSNIKEHDRTSIHEAMEQQSISIAKAGMVCKLSTRCTIIAATNPKLTKYDSSEDIELNVGLASPLLSRFDVVIVLKDAQDDSWDNFLSDFILGNKDAFEMAAKLAREAGVVWDSDTLQSYFVLIKEKMPEMTEDAHLVLSRYYQRQRNSETRNVARTTVRLLESLFRLAEGHARLMYRNCVLLQDAVTAVSLVEASMQSSALSISLPNTLHISFPINPLQEYYNQAKIILETLDLPQLWASERIYLETLSQQNSRKNNPTPPPPPSVPRNGFVRHESSQHIVSASPYFVSETQNSRGGSTGRPNTGIVPETNYSQSHRLISSHHEAVPCTPELFFTEDENDDDYDENVYQCRISSTQNQGQHIAPNVVVEQPDTEFLSPIPISNPRRNNNLLTTPFQRNNSVTDEQGSSCTNPNKRKRNQQETSASTTSANSTVNNGPLINSRDSDNSSSSKQNQTLSNSVRATLSRFRREED